MSKPRHELKYSVNYADYLTARSRLRLICHSDRYANPDGFYQIRSLYFDTIDNEALLEKQYGVLQREKFRIRYYNNDTSYIRLEKKSKYDNLCTKVSAPISRGETERLLRGDIDFLAASDNMLLREFYAKLRFKLLRPVAVVEYLREAYCYNPGNVRVTFDSCIKTSYVTDDFFAPALPLVPVSDARVMEVKYDEFLPSVIKKAVQTGERRQQAISKYALARKYF